MLNCLIDLTQFGCSNEFHFAEITNSMATREHLRQILLTGIDQFAQRQLEKV